ncbi:hypothetical protein [Mastigocoleus testarum]|nr:hypothetical protein [Mastigocoleus testarum]
MNLKLICSAGTGLMGGAGISLPLSPRQTGQASYPASGFSQS